MHGCGGKWSEICLPSRLGVRPRLEKWCCPDAQGRLPLTLNWEGSRELLQCACVCSTGDLPWLTVWAVLKSRQFLEEACSAHLSQERLTEEGGLRLRGRHTWMQILPPHLLAMQHWKVTSLLCTLVFSCKMVP